MKCEQPIHQLWKNELNIKKNRFRILEFEQETRKLITIDQRIGIFHGNMSIMLKDICLGNANIH